MLQQEQWLASPLADAIGMRTSSFVLFNLAGTVLWAGSRIAGGLGRTVGVLSGGILYGDFRFSGRRAALVKLESPFKISR